MFILLFFVLCGLASANQQIFHEDFTNGLAGWTTINNRWTASFGPSDPGSYVEADPYPDFAIDDKRVCKTVNGKDVLTRTGISVVPGAELWYFMQLKRPATGNAIDITVTCTSWIGTPPAAASATCAPANGRNAFWTGAGSGPLVDTAACMFQVFPAGHSCLQVSIAISTEAQGACIDNIRLITAPCVKGSICGDPHFHPLSGAPVQYVVNGIHNHVYNTISHPEMQVNTRWVNVNPDAEKLHFEAIWIGEAGIQIASGERISRVRITASKHDVFKDCHSHKCVMEVEIDGIARTNLLSPILLFPGTDRADFVVLRGNNLLVSTPIYSMVFWDNGKILNSKYTVVNRTRAHPSDGVLGQTLEGVPYMPYSKDQLAKIEEQTKKADPTFMAFPIVERKYFFRGEVEEYALAGQDLWGIPTKYGLYRGGK